MAIARVHAVFRCRLFPVNVQIAGNARDISPLARAQTFVHFARHAAGNLQKTERRIYIYNERESEKVGGRERNISNII